MLRTVLCLNDRNQVKQLYRLSGLFKSWGICMTLMACLPFLSFAQQNIRVSGVVTDSEHHPLPFAGVYVSGTTIGTSANGEGKYFLMLPPGDHLIVCRYLGYEKQQQEVHITTDPVEMNFVMQNIHIRIDEVVINSGEDPAYGIIRKAIEKRSYYENQINEYTCQAYIKGVMRMDNGPDKFLGQEMDYSHEAMDSSHSGIIFLSESLSKIHWKSPGDLHQEVISSRQSGGGMGFDFPIFIDFYLSNMTLVARQFAPRGYISPLADRALYYYRYQLAGTFEEDGHIINKIQVIPRRKHEPLFSGYINIMDSSWRIHSLDLLITHQQQLEVIDSLRIRQIHAAVTDSVWRIRNQSLECNFNQLNFRVHGSFISVYSDYNLHPDLSKAALDSKIIMRYDSLADKRSKAYWDSTRPVPLDHEEQANFRVKDSISTNYQDSIKSKHFIDSIRKEQKPPGLKSLLWGGYRLKQYKETGMEIYWGPLLRKISFNTVEGLVTQAELEFRSHRPSGASWNIAPTFRYGWSNRHFNAFVQTSYHSKKQFGTTWEAAGGKRVSQFNHDDPINPLANSVQTLFWGENYMKLYENYFGTIGANHRYLNGIEWHASLTYEDRYPLQNTTDFSIIQYKPKKTTSNHPYELNNIPFDHHQAFIAGVTFSYQPGQRYIQYPWGKMSVGSQAPVFGIGYTMGFPNLLGSDVNYAKWYANVQDDINLQLFGTLKYKLQVGGFLNARTVSIPDLQHFNGNKTFFNIKYLNSFQLAPYYAYSNDAPVYSTLNAEYHLNGLLTNKIPLFNRLHWNLVLGSNAFYVNEDQNYLEGFIGLENIFKFLRIDLVTGYQSGDNTAIGVRVGLGGLLGGLLQITK